LRLCSATTNVQEVSGLTTVELTERTHEEITRGSGDHITQRKPASLANLDEVHGGHGEAGTVNEATDAAVETNVVDVILMRRHVARVLLRLVPNKHNMNNKILNRKIGKSREYYLRAENSGWR